MRDAVVSAWQWDGTVAGAQAIQAQFGDAQEMSVYQSAKAGSVPMLQIRNLASGTFGSTTAAPSHYVVMMSDGKSLQVMEPAAFMTQYAPKSDAAPTGGSANAGTPAAAGPQSAPASPADSSSAQTASTGSAGPPA